MKKYIQAADRTFFRTLVIGIREYTEEELMNTNTAARRGWDSLLVGIRALDTLEVGESCTDTEGNTWTRNA